LFVLISASFAQTDGEGNLFVDSGVNRTEFNVTEFEFEFGLDDDNNTEIELIFENNSTGVVELGELPFEEFNGIEVTEIEIIPSEEFNTTEITPFPEEYEIEIIPSEEFNSTEIELIPPVFESEEFNVTEGAEVTELEIPIESEIEIITEQELPSQEEESWLEVGEGEVPNEVLIPPIFEEGEVEIPNEENETPVVVIPPEEKPCGEDDVDVDVGIQVILNIVCKGKHGKALKNCEKDIGLQYNLQGSIDLNYISNGEQQNIVKTFNTHN